MTLKDDLKNLDFTDPTIGSGLIMIMITMLTLLFDQYIYIPIVLPAYVLLILILLVFLLPGIFIKYYYFEYQKLVPESKLFIHARKKKFPITQVWNSNGFFKFEKTNITDVNICNAPKTFTIKGLEVYQQLITTNHENTYKEAFQNIPTTFTVTDIQTFRQMIETLKKIANTYLLKLIIISAVAIMIVLISIAVFLRLTGKV